MNDEKENLNEEELWKRLENTLETLAVKHNRREIMKMIKDATYVVYRDPKGKFSLSSRYTMPCGKKMKAVLVIAGEKEFQQELYKTMKMSTNMEYGVQIPEKMNKNVNGVRINID